MRLELEMVALNFAVARINPSEFDLLENNIGESEEEILKGMRPLEVNLNFHLLLAKASNNPSFELFSN